MDENTIKNDLESIEGVIASFTPVIEAKIESIETAIGENKEIIYQTADYRLGRVEVTVLPYITLLSVQASHRILRLTFHASPEIIAIIMAMVSIYNFVTFLISIFNVLTIIGTIWQINQMIMAVWPRYRDWFNGVLAQVSEISGYIGWGVDGIGHLINACSGGINILGGLMGKDWNVMRAEIMERSNELVVQMSRMLTSLKDDPGRVLNQLFENRTLLSADSADKWWSPIAETIADSSYKATTALKGVQGVFSDLIAIQTNMPETVRRNIPTSIWTALADADTYIEGTIKPALAQIDRSLEWVLDVQGLTINKFGEIADRLAHPGEILLGVDELPDYAKAYQQRLIDDVTSREFDLWTDMERNELGADLDEFDRIDRLATAPTPEPAFLTMEVPVGKTIRGITAEYKENWFVGDY